MLHTESGEKMSKSKGNVINPLDVSKKYGVDALRFFLISVASPDKDFNWSEKGIQGSYKFIKKIYMLYINVSSLRSFLPSILLHTSVKVI